MNYLCKYESGLCHSEHALPPDPEQPLGLEPETVFHLRVPIFPTLFQRYVVHFKEENSVGPTPACRHCRHHIDFTRKELVP